MAVYKITNENSALSAVEFNPVSDGNFSFFYLKDGTQKEDIKSWLTKELRQEIVAETMVDGKPVIVSHGEKSKQQMLEALQAHGDTPKLKVYKEPINYWAIRGGMSIVGQCLQLASATLQVEEVKKGHPLLNSEHPRFNPKLKEGMYVRKGFSPDIGAFAILNLTANAINMIYGGQKEEAINQLHAIKSDLNANLNDHITKTERTFDVRENRSHLHKDEELEKNKGTMAKVNAVLAENSVRLGEIGLRYVAALALVFPTNKLGKGFAQLKQGKLLGAWNASKNTNTGLLYAGGGYVLGKTLALFAKVPDPYDDKPKTTLDTLREDYLFKVGGLIEAVAGGSVGYNAFKTKKIGLANNKSPSITPHTDYLGGIGGSLFATGYIVRYWAKFGSKHLDTEEVFAHATDTLAKTPPEKLPQLMAESAATIKEHLKDKPVEYGEIFTKMMTDMYRYHHIALDNLGTEPAERVAKMNATEEPQQRFAKRLERNDPRPDEPMVGRHLFERRKSTPSEIAAAAPAGTHAERAKATEQNTGLAV